jgi:hypothetical protein
LNYVKQYEAIRTRKANRPVRPEREVIPISDEILKITYAAKKIFSLTDVDVSQAQLTEGKGLPVLLESCQSHF